MSAHRVYLIKLGLVCPEVLYGKYQIFINVILRKKILRRPYLWNLVVRNIRKDEFLEKRRKKIQFSWILC